MIKTTPHHNRRAFLKSGAFAALGFGCLGPVSRAAAMMMQPAYADGKGTHNMLVVGEQTVYLSHLPMFQGLNEDGTDFQSPHRYQVILEATLSDASGDLTKTYTADRKSHPTERMYTLNPALFVLPELDPAGTSLRTFRGNTLFRGHLERGGKPIVGFLNMSQRPPQGGVFDVNVTRVVHFHKFVFCTPRPAELGYILFGKGTETFLAHLIVTPPEFDQIISVKLTGQQFSDADLAKGIKVSIAGRPNTALTRLRVGEKAASGTATIAGSTTVQPVQIEALREFYFEEGELRYKDDMNPTPEEIKSKFNG